MRHLWKYCSIVVAAALLAVLPAEADRDKKVTKLINAARVLSKKPTEYDPSYQRMAYPLGDVDADKGVCTDIIVRAFRAIGIDLQKLIHNEMTADFDAYPAKRVYGQKKPDANIDHRRVTNLDFFFNRRGKSLTLSIDPKHLGEWLPGDIVIFDLKGTGTSKGHIGIISDRKDKASGRPLVFHHFPPYPAEDDALGDFAVSGHYRYLR